MGILFFFIFLPIFTLLLAGAAGGPSLHRPNGYLPRGGGLRPKWYGNASFKHGKAYQQASLEDFLDSKPGKTVYWNSNTGQMQDDEP